MPPILLRAISGLCRAAACLALAACAAPPPAQLYVLSPSSQDQVLALAPAAASGTGRGAPAAAGRATSLLIGVAVSVPEYLDRPEIVQRSSPNEIKPVYSALWGESLTVATTRAMTENLTALLPMDDVLMLPSRSTKSFDYQVNLDLYRFETDPSGRSIVTGRWSITDMSGIEQASGRVSHLEPVDGTGNAAVAAAMSRNLAAVSDEISVAVRKLPPPRRL